LDTTVESPPASEPAQKGHWRRLKWLLNPIFVCAVLLPTTISIIYFGLIASDVYVSESRFVVRNPQRQSSSGIGSLLQSSGLSFTRSQDDTYSVHDYVTSRDALRELDQRAQVRKALSSDKVDRFNRFPGLDWDDSFEGFFRHYRKYVTIDYDTVSSITTLYVRAYTAEDARKFNDLLLQMGERLVNNLNTRSRQDLIEVAQKEVRDAEERDKAAALAMSGFRTKQSLFDPERQAGMKLQGVAKIQEELITAEAELAQIRLLSPNSPQLGALKNRVETLRKAVAAENAKVAGAEGSFTSKTSAYDRLLLEKTFADRQLATALASLESARNEAQRKQLYLERLVQPNLPDMAAEPRRMRSVLVVFVLGMIVFGVVSLIVASIREHTE